MSTPSILYKYINFDYVLPVLRNLKLKLTPPVEFNDPFEFLMRSDDILRRSTVKKMMKDKDFKRQLYEASRAQGEPVGSFKNFRRRFVEKREQYIDKALQDSLPKMSAYVKGPFLAELSSRFAVLCLSELPDSILMWSHYAGGHTGIALGIEIPPHWKMLQVVYGKTRVPANLRWPHDPFESEDTSYALVKTKSKHREYEKEWRALSQLEKLHRQEQNGKVLYFAAIPPEIIKEIILGLRFPERQLPEIRALHKSKFPQAKILQTSLHDSEFALVMKQIG